MTTDYRPIACGLVDELQLRVMRGRTSDILFRRDGSEFAVRARIVDVNTRGGAEWLDLEGGDAIRLDELVAVDGLDFTAVC